MKTTIISLKNEYGLKGGVLKALAMDTPWDNGENWRRPAIIVVPGGAYAFVSKREGEPVALEFLAKGFQAFVLDYAVGGENGFSYPEQLFEVACSVDYVKKHADEFNVNPDEVFVVGFSAGGHLAGNFAVECDDVPVMLGKKIDCRPTAVGLCYPVISNALGHLASHENLLYGYTDEAKAELLKKLNLDQAVKETTPPAFIWSTVEDTCVPSINALSYALACDKKGVSYELHIYPHGNHGKSTGAKEINDDEPTDQIKKWLPACIDFFHSFVVERH